MKVASRIVGKFRAEFAGQLISVASSAILIVTLARLLNPDGYGLLFLAISIFGTVEVFSKLGVAKSGARYITDYNEKDLSVVPSILKFSFLLNLVVLFIVSFLFYIIHREIAILFEEPEIVPLLFLGIFYIIFSTIYLFSRRMLQGFEDIRYAALIKSLNKIIRVILAIGLVFIGYGATGALFGYIIGFIISGFIGIMILYIRYYSRQNRTPIDISLRKRIVKYSGPLTVTDGANVLDKRVDTLLVGFFLNPTAVAFYMIGKQVVTFIETPMAALGFTLSPTYNSEKVKGNIELAANIYEQALCYALLIYIPAATGLILIAEPFVKIIFGGQYTGAVPVLQVLSVYAVLQAITKLTSNGLDFLGRARERAVVMIFTSISNVVLNIILIPRFGVVGAAFATLITFSIYTFANLYIIKIELGIDTTKITKHAGIVCVIALIMALPVYFFSGYISGIISLISTVLLGVVIWASASIIFGLISMKDIEMILGS